MNVTCAKLFSMLYSPIFDLDFVDMCINDGFDYEPRITIIITISL